jgi:hypothetical protein
VAGIERMAVPNLSALAARCESIGRNCEFGLVQRALGQEPLGLLRWAASPLRAVTLAMETRFVGLGRDMTFILDTEGEWLSTDIATGLTFHTHFGMDQTEEEVRCQESRRLPRLAEKLIEDIECCDRLLVYSNAELTGPLDAVPLLHAIRSIGRAPILVVSQGSDTATSLGHDAFAAFIPKLTDMNYAGGVDLPAWVRMMAEIGW